MPHNLFRLSLHSGDGPAPSPAIVRTYLDRARAYAASMGAQLNGFWIKEDGRSLVLLTRSGSVPVASELLDGFGRLFPECQIEGECLLTLNEYLDAESAQAPVPDVLILDQVEIASDLSFPASDPPSWIAGRDP